VYGDYGVVDGVEDVEDNTIDTFSCPGKASNGGEERMERRCHRGFAANFINVMYDHVLEVEHNEGSLLA
jgi:hypothetical protein